MTPRRWPALLLLALAGLLPPGPAHSQPASRFRQLDERPPKVKWGGAFLRGDEPPAGAPRPSHKPVGTGLESNLRPEEAAIQRLMGVRKAKQEQDEKESEALQGQIQELAKKLLGNEKFMESINGLSREDAQRLLEKVRGGGGICDNPALHKLLREGLAGKTLPQDQQDLVNRWKDKLREKGVPEPAEGAQPDGGTPAGGKPAPPPTPPAGERPPQP